MREELQQKTFEKDDFTPPIVASNEPHMALLFLLDVSGSMEDDDAIGELNRGLRQFKKEVCSDSRTRKILDVAIVTFSSRTEVVLPFTPVQSMEFDTMEAYGGTNMSDAIELAVQMVDERSRFYRKTSVNPYKPWILMVSDGMPNDDISHAVDMVRERVEGGYLNFISLGVGAYYDSKTLHKLSGERVMRLKGTEFKPFFDWTTKSMRSISQSSPGERPKGVPLPQEIDKETDSWM